MLCYECEQERYNYSKNTVSMGHLAQGFLKWGPQGVLGQIKKVKQYTF
jgi:hypothetical protein